jgi:hypothetical protein
VSGAAKGAVFISKVELARHLCVTPRAIDQWIAAGEFPPPHSRPGPRVALWRRRDWRAYVRDGRWPAAAFGPANGEARR